MPIIIALGKSFCTHYSLLRWRRDAAAVILFLLLHLPMPSLWHLSHQPKYFHLSVVLLKSAVPVTYVKYESNTNSNADKLLEQKTRVCQHSGTLYMVIVVMLERRGVRQLFYWILFEKLIKLHIEMGNV